MTIINKTYGFIFIHVPKTGGTSVKEHLREYGEAGDVHINLTSDAERLRLASGIKLRKHSTARDVCKAIGAYEYECLFRFCVVRNPFVRTLSLFRFLKFNFRAWPRADVMDELHTLEEFVAAPIFRSAGPGGIISPQMHWITDQAGRRYVDFIARTEKIEDDLLEIRARLQLPPPSKPLLRRNASKGDAGHLIPDLTAGSVVDAIRTRYASDFQFLGYSTDPDEAAEFEGTAAAYGR